MVGLVLVSHSRKLALALRELVLQMAGEDFPLAVAAGVGEEHELIGTDAVHIAEILQPFLEGDGAVVLMDLGSAVLSAQTALELLDTSALSTPDGAAFDLKTKLRLCAAPLVEAAVAAAVQARAGASLDEVEREAFAALAPKQVQLGEEESAAASVTENAVPVAAAATLGSVPGECEEFEIVVENPHGLHARPAATLVQAVSRFDSDVRLTNVTGQRGPSPARSLSSVSLLQVRRGDRLHFRVCGRDASQAAQQLRALAAARFGESEPTLDGAELAPIAALPRVGWVGGTAIGAAEGVALGRAIALNVALPLPSEEVFGTVEEEWKQLARALEQVAREMAHEQASGTAAEILAAQALILRDPVLLDAVRASIAQGRIAAARAWRQECDKLAGSYAAMEDEYMRARAADVRDLALRVLRVLAGSGQPLTIAPDPPAVLLTTELLPSEAMACDPAHVLGVVASAGSATAHAAILLRSRGIPMVVGATQIDASKLLPETVLALDGGTGEVWIDPSEEQQQMIRARQQAQVATRAAFQAARHQPAIMRDGQRIEVLANVSSANEARAATENGAEGIGLLRTEFVYLDQKQMPSEDEQTEALECVLRAAGPGPVVVRTPDVGADKPLSWLPAPAEHNPFLGVRGLRLSLLHPEFFRSNLRAILRAGRDCDLWIMVPMVSMPEEMRQARAYAVAAHEALTEQGIAHRWPVKLGMMVEVPSAALEASRFAAVADFFSIGTNDLTQYVMAAERGNAGVASLQDAAHPAVLRTIQAICRAAADSACHVSVCGDAASEIVTAALLVGLGVRSLSVRANQVAAIKAQLRQMSLAELEELAIRALGMDSGAEVRAAALLRIGPYSKGV